jgi:biofilm PGA synthesis N-glycosyltransferase PgaC
MSTESVVFWGSVLLLSYTYVGYPALVCLWAAVRPGHLHRPAQCPDPTVTVLIVAHNEAPRIDERIDNVLALDYPPDRLEIIVASDGSDDGTAERARRYEEAGVTTIGFGARRGKPAILNDVVPMARGEIVLFADARQRFEPGVLRTLTGVFGDPRVGAVSGELILTANDRDGTAAGNGVGFYWRYEKFIRRRESRLDSTIGATGAIYAIRRDLFEPVAEETILDDVLIPLRIVRRGYRVLFESRARAYDRAATTAEAEFMRKVRTIAGTFQLLVRERWLLNPFRNRLWVQTVSHKGLRLVGPLFLVSILGANLFLLQDWLYVLTLGGQLVFYAAALGGHALRNAKRKVPLLSVPYVFCALNWAAVIALVRFVSGRQRVTWDKAPT